HPRVPIGVARYSVARENWRVAYVDPVPSAASADCLVPDECAVELRGSPMAKAGKARLRKAGTVTAAAIAVGGAAAGWIGVAEASIPAANGKIYACYANKGGALRVINYPAQHCHSGETRI